MPGSISVVSFEQPIAPRSNNNRFICETLHLFDHLVPDEAAAFAAFPRYCSPLSNRSRSQSPNKLMESVVVTINVAGANMIHGARVIYSRP